MRPIHPQKEASPAASQSLGGTDSGTVTHTQSLDGTTDEEHSSQDLPVRRHQTQSLETSPRVVSTTKSAPPRSTAGFIRYRTCTDQRCGADFHPPKGQGIQSGKSTWLSQCARQVRRTRARSIRQVSVLPGMANQGPGRLADRGRCLSIVESLSKTMGRIPWYA
jgi:hypothetical protein